MKNKPLPPQISIWDLCTVLEANGALTSHQGFLFKISTTENPDEHYMKDYNKMIDAAVAKINKMKR